MAGTPATINASITATAVLVQDYLDGLTAGVRVKFIFCPSNVNGTALDTGDFPGGFGAAGSGANFQRYVYSIKKTNDAVNMVYFIQGLDIGGIPLYWKIATAASESLAIS